MKNQIELSSWEENTEYHTGKTTWKDVVAFIIGTALVTTLILAVIIIGH